MNQTDIQRQLVEATQAFQSYRTKVDRILVTKGLAPIPSGSLEIDLLRRHWRLASEASEAATHIRLNRELA